MRCTNHFLVVMMVMAIVVVVVVMVVMARVLSVLVISVQRFLAMMQHPFPGGDDAGV